MGSTRKNKPKIIVILGPTASGKSDLAVKLSLRLGGEVVSADSRQVYGGMDIGSGKITQEEMKGVPHHLLDVANPKRKFTVVRYKKLSEEKVKKILKKGKIPVVCGGTAFYIEALIDGITIPEVPPDWKMRKRLEKETTENLYAKLKKLDPERAKNIDKKNRRRLVRAIEIVEKSKEPVPNIKKDSPYQPLFLGIKIDRERLDNKIEKRLKKRLNQGMIEEVKGLRESGVSWKRLEEFGLEYKWVAQYLQNKIDYNDMYENIIKDTRRLSKNQMQWWKKDRRINWIETCKEAEKLTQNFLNSP